MKKAARQLFFIFAGIAVLFFPGSALGEPGADKTLSPYFVVQGGDSSTESFPLKATDVMVTIKGVIADVHVTQKYANEGDQPINASYVFPASTQASVHGLEMAIGDRVVRAKIKEREAAKQEFETAKSQGKSASLLDQQRPNVFTMSVSNIMPKDEVQISLHYTELLPPTEGVYEFVYPTVVGPRYSNQSEEGAPSHDRFVKSGYLPEGGVPQTEFSLNVELSAGMPIRYVQCPSHRINVIRDGESEARVALAPSDDFAGNRDFILQYGLVGKEIQSGLMLYNGEKENFFLLMVQPPERVKPADIPPREYIFVLDVSGSMHGFPLDTAKALIRDLIGNLRETDVFNLVAFSGASSIMSPASLPATRENIQEAVAIIDGQRGGGGTELAAALRQAISTPRNESYSRSVVVITDGYIAAEKETFALIRDNLDRINVFAFGIGSSVNRHLIEGIAKAGLGESFVVTKPGEARGAAARFRTYIESPVLSNVEVNFKGFDAYDVEPLKVPDLFAQRPLVVFGKWRGEGHGEIQVTGKAGSGGYNRSFDLAGTKPLATNSALRYLWARSRVARLSDFAAGTGSSDHKEEITRIGLEYSLLTQYTSFIAVLDEIRNTQGRAKDVDQPLPLPRGVSNLAVAGGLVNAPEPEMVLFVPAVLLTLLAIVAYRRRGMASGPGGAI